MKAAETSLLLKGLSGAPQGVIEWSTEVPGMFETSNNVGVVGMADGTCTVNYYVRGPNVSDAHTINEHVEIGSVERAWEYILELLKNM